MHEARLREQESDVIERGLGIEEKRVAFCRVEIDVLLEGSNGHSIERKRQQNREHRQNRPADQPPRQAVRDFSFSRHQLTSARRATRRMK
jgi:hypothetical protein